MRTAAVLPFVLVGCGASVTAAPVEEPARERAPSAEAAPPAAPPEAVDWMSNELAQCVRGGPEPEGPVIASDSAGVVVREGSISLEREGRVVCRADDGVSGRLVLVVEPYGGLSIATLEGERVRLDAETFELVRLPGAASITAVRSVEYCPERARDCVVAGSLDAVEAYADVDPDAPRSGWDVAIRTVSPVRLRRAGTEWLAGSSCGLAVGLRGAPSDLECNEPSLEARLSCIAREADDRDEAIYEAESDEALAEARASRDRVSARFQLVVADARQELSLPAFDVAAIACVEGQVILRARTREFSSSRAYGAIVVREDRIAGGHWMSIRDHEEDRSECANAWDGVQLVPVLREGAVIGGIVLGAGGRPLFEVERGDVGDVRTPALWPGVDGAAPREVEEGSFAYGDEPIPIALRETPEALVAIAASTPPPTCALVVNDADGQTNVRPEPSTRRTPSGTLANGTVIVPVEQRGRWYRVETPARGWLYAENLDRRCVTP
jgi:hypothetical protein